jgi:hypothetical protein
MEELQGKKQNTQQLHQVLNAISLCYKSELANMQEDAFAGMTAVRLMMRQLISA